jgi:hypothetical protein
MTETLKPADFRDLSSPLTLTLGAQPVSLAIQSVTPLPPHRLRAEPFSMILAGPLAPALPQASYRVRHPTLGEIDLFLVPIARGATSMQYEATFN